jgi:hypothetical protein
MLIVRSSGSGGGALGPVSGGGPVGKGLLPVFLLLLDESTGMLDLRDCRTVCALLRALEYIRSALAWRGLVWNTGGGGVVMAGMADVGMAGPSTGGSWSR